MNCNVIVDAQNHVWKADRVDRPWPRAAADGRTGAAQSAVPFGPADALVAMDLAGVDCAILVPPSWEGDRNDCALGAATAHPSRFGVMGRLAPNLDPDQVAAWRDQPNMLGTRVILSTDAPWIRDGTDHWLWHTRLPLMIAPAGNLSLLGAIASRCRDLPIIVDHMGARVHRTGADAFVDLDALVALARLPNVAVKATCLPAYSAGPKPWADVTPYLCRLFDAFGAHRLFWGSDLSRLPCPYGDIIDVFRTGLDWLSGKDRDLVMGDAILTWLDWR